MQGKGEKFAIKILQENLKLLVRNYGTKFNSGKYSCSQSLLWTITKKRRLSIQKENIRTTEIKINPFSLSFKM